MNVDWWIGKYLKGHGQIDVLSRHLSGEAEENYEKPQPGWQMSRPILESRISRIQIKIVTTMPIHSLQLGIKKKEHDQ
jgi:hypothetical protein